MSTSRGKETKPIDHWTTPQKSPAYDTALYFGFIPAENVPVEKSDRDNAKSFHSEHESHPDIVPEEKIALIRHYFEKGLPSLPLMHISERKHADRKNIHEYSLDVIGTSR